MSVTEVLGGLGSWTVKLADETPDDRLSQLGFFGHIVIVRGRVDVDATSGSLLAAARYVGVLRDRSKDRRTLEGDGMLFWLGDEDDKGKVLETAVNLTGQSLAASVAAVLPPAVHTGTINSAAGTYTGKHQFETPRAALDTITAAFGVEYRVNGTATIDVGTQAQLYRTSPVVIIAAKNAGQDMDLTSLGASFDVEESVRDYSSRVLLVGSSFDNGTTTTFATGSADAPSVPYVDPWGNTVQMTRMISESGTTTGSVASRAQLQLNRFNRAAVALKVTATDYDIGAGSFAVGDNAYVYDPANGIFDTTRSVDFRGELIHPDVVRISGVTWPVSDDHTVAFRTAAGAWVDLTPWVVWESGGGEITVGDLPKSLTSGGGNPVQDRADSLPDATIPTAPTGLSLSTFAVVDPKGGLSAIIRASWTAPTVNTDGTVITDLASYFVRWRVVGRAAWEGSAVGVVQFDIPVLIDTDYEVQVAAVDRSNHSSAYTSSVTIHASVDTVAPSAPSDPTVTSYLGQLRIAWDGLTNTATAMPNDFNRVDVHVSATTGFTPSTSTLVSSLSTAGVAYATAPYGSTRFVKLVAYDNAGNASAPSGQVSGATVQVADGDVAALSVGKLTAGTMSADVVMSGRFATALTGARVEMNSLGFQKFDATSATLVSITGTEALLTGIFKTAITGRRIEIGAAGSTGEANFIAPDGTTTKIQAFSSSLPTTGIEVIAVRAPITGTYGAWNAVQVQNNQHAYMLAGSVHVNYGGDATTGSFRIEHATDKGNATTPPQLDARMIIDEANGTRMYDNGNRLRVWLSNDGGFQLFDGDDVNNAGDQRFVIANDTTTIYNPAGPNNAYLGQGQIIVYRDQTVIRANPNTTGDDSYCTFINSGAASSSVRFSMVNRNGFGGLFKYWYDGGQERIEARNATDAGFVPLWASAFTVNSDRSAKDNIRALSFDRDPLDALTPRRFVRPGWEGKKGGRVADWEQFGFVTDEMPSELVTGDPASGKATGIDLMALLTATVASLQGVKARVVALERGRP